MPDPQSTFVALETPTTSSHLLHVDEPPNTDKEDVPAKKANLVPLAQLFSFADKTDLVLMAGGTISAIGMGLSQPIQMVLFGDIINSFNPSAPVEPEVFRAGINKVARNFAIVGAAVVVCGFLQVACWSLTASRQIKRIRSAYVSAILTKELGWFDVNEPMELSSRAAESAVTIQNGMGRKVGDGINYTSMAVSAIIIALVKGWELALVLLAFTPVIAVTGFFAMKVLSVATQSGVDAYSKAGAIAQESLSNIRTVHMFNAIQHFINKYEDALRLSTKAGIKKGSAVGLGMGLLFFTIFCAYALGLFYGTLKIVNGRRDGCTGDSCYDGGRVITVFFSTIMGAMALGQAGPCIEAFVSGRAAAYDVFTVIHRQSLIDPLSEAGTKLSHVDGKIEIDRISFAYPSRPDVRVCSDYSLTINPGETVALVGRSGSGKSTIVSLLERFYDPQTGSVKLDGVDVRELNVKWLRQQIGLVGQEPALFATSIMENIRYGCPGATDAQVIEAAKMANAFSFVKEFPLGFETEVGERGTQLSGGQKQRIAIARAIIKNPPILLLDEATSALDTESERVVQESLDALLASSATTRTTIIVAHRLSTIRNASKIAVHDNGAIVELGTHDELMNNPNGHYRHLVEAQQRGADQGDDEGSMHEMSQGSMKMSRRSSSTRSLDRKTSFKREKGDDSDGSVSADDTGADSNPVSVWRVWTLSFPEWKHLVLGSVGAFAHASVFPLWGVLLTKMIVLFYEDKPRSDLLRTARYWSAGFVGLGIAFCVSMTMQHYGFAVVSQRLISRVRLAVFTAMLRQEIGWFDRKENVSGALVARLATDSATLQAMTADLLNQGLVSLTTITIAFGIAFYSSWEMTLLLVATAPLFVFSSVVEAQMMNGSAGSKQENDADTAAGSLLAEAIGSIRTVASLSLEKQLNASYVMFLETSKKADAQAGMMGGAAFGASQGIMFFNVSLLFYLGGKWVSTGRITFEDMFRVIMVIMLSMIAVGIAAETMTDQNQVRKAARRVFRTIDRTPEIDATSTSGETLAQVRGDIAFQGIAFAYPSRPDARIYKNYSLRIASGETVALVGASGSGKSTAIALLERMYDPAAGAVTLDGTDLRHLSLPWLRERISLVSQEPVLFAGTIADNIAMGKPGATREEIEAAAKMANAHDFISQFPNGFDTDVGDRGAQVSGGQKQRIAIARAILRDPEVLLLDEATSALDNESERVVQASLDRLLAQKKRTTIIVAHRLSTIRHADRIAVVKDGAIVEQGTHEQLMALANGEYKALVARQLGQQ